MHRDTATKKAEDEDETGDEEDSGGRPFRPESLPPGAKSIRHYTHSHVYSVRLFTDCARLTDDT